MKVLGGVAGVLAASGALFYAIRVNGNINNIKKENRENNAFY
jgi:hypothetical protein